MAERRALLTTFGLLHEKVKNTQEKSVNFKRSLEKINGTLEALKPLLEETEELKEKVVVDLQPEDILDFRSEMDKGVELVVECSKEYHGFNLSEITIHKEKLEKLDETLQRLIQIIQGERNTKETSIKVEELYEVKESNKGFGVVDNGNTSKTATFEGPDAQFSSISVGLEDDTVKKVNTYGIRILSLVLPRLVSDYLLILTLPSI